MPENLQIAMLNITSLIFIAATIVVIWVKYAGRFRCDNSMILIIISFFILLLVTGTNILEHLNITDYFDFFEDELKIIFIPIFIFAVLAYCIRRELALNKVNEGRIMESHMRLNMSLEGAQESLWEWHPKKSSIVISHENGFLGFTPYTFEINDENFRKVIHPSSYKMYCQLKIALMEGGIHLPETVEILLLSTDNNYHWVLFRGKKVELENSDISYLGTIIDISVFKQVQNELLESQKKAAESEKLKVAFLNNISHEIRTPMNAIVGFTNLLSTENLPHSKRDEYIRIVSDSCNALLTIIEDIVEMSRILVGSIQLYTQPVNLNTLVNQLEQSYHPKAALKGFPIICYTEDLPTIIHTDEDKLVRIFSNLINNAIKFTDRGFVEIGWKTNGANIKFYVHDTGIGVDKELQDKVFQNFQKGESSDRYYAGSGLGLSICKGLTEAMGGQIWMESQPEKGTTVYFTIPDAC